MWNQSVLSLLSEGYDVSYGARSIKHEVDRKVEKCSAIVDDHAITIMKGDANYRRLLGDLHWPFDHPFVDVAAPFPGDVCALRTLKSGVCCGVSVAEQERARATDASWCTSGKFGVIQFKHDQ